jgi:hypothetical protein
LKLGGYQFAAPPDAGETSVPSVYGSLSGLGIGEPLASMPLDQLTSVNGAETRFSPVTRSSRKK